MIKIQRATGEEKEFPLSVEGQEVLNAFNIPKYSNINANDVDKAIFDACDTGKDQYIQAGVFIHEYLIIKAN